MAVLTACSAVSVNISLVPVTLTRRFVVTIGEVYDDTVSLFASTGVVWIEVVIIAVLTVSEAFVIGMDVLVVVLTHHT